MAEDNIDHAELIIDTLKDFNVANEIVHVNNGEEAIDYLTGCDQHKNTRPNLILLDLKMPRKDGITTLKEIREMPSFGQIPIVMVSTSTSDQEIKVCYAGGANSYVTKPLKFEEFSRKIKDLNLYWVLTSELPH